MLKKYRKKIKCILPIVLICLAGSSMISFMKMEHNVRPMEEVNQISYIETVDNIDNPGRGFYHQICIHYKTADNEVNTFTSNLLHMRIDLSDFSGSYNGKKDIELSQDMLDAFEASLANLKKEGGSAILRFAYDPWFCGENSYEPKMSMILKHIEQLGTVITKYEDTVVAVECGMFGKWGEMHGSPMCTEENVSLAIDAWLEHTPESVSINVRTPAQYAAWKNIDLDHIDENTTLPGQREYRIGLYDDGYLGSESDVGTYTNREKALRWLEKQTVHSLFGGELVGNSNKDVVKNTAAYMTYEGYRTHTSYLNSEWDYHALELLKMEPYYAGDVRYHGCTGYDYVQNHLGYRFVVRGVRMTTKTSTIENFALEADIENVGFANLTKPKKVLILIEGENGLIQYDLSKLNLSYKEKADEKDPTKWNSASTTTLSAVLNLPDELQAGTYHVYIRLASDAESKGKEGYPIRFANDSERIWNEELGANYVGDFVIRKSGWQKKMDKLKSLMKIGNGG